MTIPYFSRSIDAAARLLLLAVVTLSSLALPFAAYATEYPASPSDNTTKTIALPPVPDVSDKEKKTKEEVVADSAEVGEKVRKKVKAVIALAEEKKGEITTDTILNATILPPVRDLTDEIAEEVAETEDVKVDVNVSKPMSHVVRDAIDEHIEDIVVIMLIFLGLILLPFLGVIIVISMVLRSRQKFHREQLRTIENLAREGYSVPESMVNMRFSNISKRQSYSSALKWLGLGVGLAIFFSVTSSFKTAVILSIFPLVVGIVKMIIYMRFDRYSGGQSKASPESFPPQFKGVKSDDIK